MRHIPVLHVISDAGPHPYFRTLIEGGGLDRDSLIVGCVGVAGHLQQDMGELGISTFALGAKSRAQYPRAAATLARMLRRRQVQVAQTHLVDGGIVGLAAARLARTPAAVMTAHHSHELPFHGRRLLWADRICGGPLSDHVIAPSRQVADTLVELAHVPAAKIEVVHHGFDLERLDPRAVDGGAVRRELGLDGCLVFGAVGRIFWLKNYPALLRAFASTLRELPEARLVIVGAGETDALRSLASQLELTDRVILTGPRTDVAEVLAALDVFVHPAIAESFGMVIVEAMAMARPVVSTPVGIATEVIEHGRSGLVCRGADAPALAEALRKMLELRAQWPTMGAAARRRVEGFTAYATGRRYEQLYDAWLRQRPNDLVRGDR
jgi:glycosyltransferase involved in cell wall biosynthesis